MQYAMVCYAMLCCAALALLRKRCVGNALQCQLIYGAPLRALPAAGRHERPRRLAGGHWPWPRVRPACRRCAARLHRAPGVRPRCAAAAAVCCSTDCQPAAAADGPAAGARATQDLHRSNHAGARWARYARLAQERVAAGGGAARRACRGLGGAPPGCIGLGSGGLVRTVRGQEFDAQPARHRAHRLESGPRFTHTHGGGQLGRRGRAGTRPSRSG